VHISCVKIESYTLSNFVF